MAPFILFLASFLRANDSSLDWRAEFECNILYAITSEEVLQQQMEQWEYDVWLFNYLTERGIPAHHGMARCHTNMMRAENLLLARNPHNYEYSRTYFLQEAKRCN